MVILINKFNVGALNRIWSKYLLWVAILLIMQSLMKGFDQTYNGVFDFSGRSCFFSVAFFVYWLLGWSVSSSAIKVIDTKIKGKVSPAVGFIIFFFAIFFFAIGYALLFDFLYRWIDVRFFGMADIWSHTPFPHPDLVYPFILLSLLIFVVDRFAGFSLQLKDAELYAAQLEQENIQAKYDALKNQIDPHFFFNSLSVLSSIVQTDPNLSTEYILNLSKLYRYILETKQNNIVLLSEELDYLNSYIFLIKMRYPNSMDFRIEFTHDDSDKIGIHPNSLQLLVENAIKHNTFKDDDPLIIEIYGEDGYICVRNQLRKKRQLTPSTGIGLENIRKRYELHGKKIVVKEIGNCFVVKLPKIEIGE